MGPLFSPAKRKAYLALKQQPGPLYVVRVLQRGGIKKAIRYMEQRGYTLTNTSGGVFVVLHFEKKRDEKDGDGSGRSTDR